MNNRLFLFDFMRFIAFPLVILQHVAAVIAFQFNMVPMSWWWVSNFYDSISRICVPLFFIITGAVIFERNLDTIKEIKTFLFKRLIKVVIPLIAWSFIYNLYFTVTSHQKFEILSLLKSILEGNVPYAFHFWYLYAIISLYLIVPILKVFIKFASDSIVNYFLIIWFVASSLLPLASKFHIYIGIHIEYITGYIGYLVIGYKLYKYITEKNGIVLKKKFYISLITFVIALIFTMGSTYFLTVLNNNKLDEFFYTYTSFNVIIMAIAASIISVYIVKQPVFIRHPILSKVITIFSSKLSFGIYLIHILVMAVLDSGLLRFRIYAGMFHPLISIPVTTFFILIISSVIVYLIRKFPAGKFISP